MATLIIKEAMRVSAPRNSLHEDGVRIKVVTGNNLREGTVEFIPCPTRYTAITRSNNGSLLLYLWVNVCVVLLVVVLIVAFVTIIDIILSIAGILRIRQYVNLPTFTTI